MIDTVVTGATGWLGTRLVEVLTRGLADVPGLEAPRARRIRCLVQPDAQPEGTAALGMLGAELVAGDLRDATAVQRLFDGVKDATVFHAASVIHPPGRTSVFRAVNVEGTRALLTAAQGHAARVVYVSSNSPLGVNPDREGLFDEASPYHPYMGYGKSKMAAELLVQEAGEARHFETVIVRPPWFYGPNQPARQSLFFSMVRNGKFPILGDGEQRRSMAYVDNLCQGLLLAERTQGAAGQCYWIADERPYSMNEIVATIQRVMERDFGVSCAKKQTRLPGFLGTAAEWVDAGIQAVGLYHQKIHVLGEMNKTIACSVEKARRELGYVPTVGLEEGMKRSLAWMAENGQSW